MRRKFFFAVYEADHYMQDAHVFKGKNRHAGALSPDKAKQLVLKWERSVDRKTVVDGYKESFALVNSKEECNSIKREIDSFIDFFKRDVEKGDKHTLNWFPGGRVEVLINGALAGSVENEAFARALWRIWFAHNGVVSRDDLLSKLK